MRDKRCALHTYARSSSIVFIKQLPDHFVIMIEDTVSSSGVIPSKRKTRKRMQVILTLPQTFLVWVICQKDVSSWRVLLWNGQRHPNVCSHTRESTSKMMVSLGERYHFLTSEKTSFLYSALKVHKELQKEGNSHNHLKETLKVKQKLKLLVKECETLECKLPFDDEVFSFFPQNLGSSASDTSYSTEVYTWSVLP